MVNGDAGPLGRTGDDLGAGGGHAVEGDRVGLGRRSTRLVARVRRARSGFWELLERRPLVVGAAVLAAGFLLGLAFPPGRPGDRAWSGRPDASPSIH